jgi:hypothetical protein
MPSLSNLDDRRGGKSPTVRSILPTGCDPGMPSHCSLLFAGCSRCFWRSRLHLPWHSPQKGPTKMVTLMT